MMCPANQPEIRPTRIMTITNRTLLAEDQLESKALAIEKIAGKWRKPALFHAGRSEATAAEKMRTVEFRRLFKTQALSDCFRFELTSSTETSANESAEYLHLAASKVRTALPDFASQQARSHHESGCSERRDEYSANQVLRDNPKGSEHPRSKEAAD